MAPDTLKILLLRWKPSLGVMGFGRDGKPSLSLSFIYLLITFWFTYIIMICLFVCYMQLCCLVLLLCAGCMLLRVESVLEAWGHCSFIWSHLNFFANKIFIQSLYSYDVRNGPLDICPVLYLDIVIITLLLSHCFRFIIALSLSLSLSP